MAKIDLTKYGITGVTEIVHNPSYEELYKDPEVDAVISVGGGELMARAEAPAYCYYGDAGVAGGLDVGSGVAYHNGVGLVGPGF